MPMFENYDENLAAGLQRAHENEGGLPGFLGIRLGFYYFQFKSR